MRTGDALHRFALTPAIRHAWGDRDIPPEQPLIEWARQFQTHDTIALDIGAHVGDWAVDMAAHSKSVVAFEAQASTYALLLEYARPYTNVRCHHVALGALPGSADLLINAEDGGGSSVNATPLHVHARVERVPVQQLDAYNLSDVGLVKIDVEGAERSVLEGAVETLRRSRWPKIIFEAWSYDWFVPQRAELMAYLAALRYRITRTTWPDTYIAERP